MTALLRSAGVLLPLLSAAAPNVQADCTTPGRAEIIEVRPIASAEVSTGILIHCQDPPPGQTAQQASCRGRLPDFGTAAVASVNVESSSPTRIAISGSVQTFCCDGGANHIAHATALVTLRAVDGPIRLTVNSTVIVVTNGVITTHDFRQNTFDLPEGEPVDIAGGAASAVTGPDPFGRDFAPSSFSGNILTIDIQPLPVQGPPQTTFAWNNEAGGPYDLPDNWLPDCDFPQHDGQRSDTASFGLLFDDAGNDVISYAVSANGATAGRFIVDRITLDLDGNAEVFAPSTGEPSLSIIRAGRLLLDNGARLTGVHGSVGFTPATGFSGQAALQILGAGTDATFSGRLIVGEFAEGTLALADGGTLSCDEAIVGDIAVGQAALRGTGSRWDANSITLGAVSAAGTVEVRESAALEIVDKLTVGDLSTGTLRLVDGGRVAAAEVELGKQASGVSRGDGTIELSGDSGSEVSLLRVNGALRVGIGGDGAVFVREGGTVRADSLEFPPVSTSGSARITVQGVAVDGSFSEFTVFNPARLGNGLLEVFDGARAFFSDLTLGDGGDTDVTVSGFDDPEDSETAAMLSANRLRVGFEGLGTLTVETGGKVACSDLTVGSVTTGGVGRVNVPGGKVEVNGELKVSGDSQEGENIVIEAGGGITARSLRLGDEDTADSAEIVVRDVVGTVSSHLAIATDAFNAECFIGVDGPGVLRMENDAVVTVMGSARVGASPLGGEGLVEIGADCTFTISGNLDVGGPSPGTIRLITESSELNVGGSAVINAGGRVEGIGTFNGPRFVNPGGFVSPGLSPGTLTIKGDYEQGEGGTLIIEVAGTEPGQFDVLHVTGKVTLAGTLEVRFLDGFLPRAGDRVDFLEVASNVTGEFAQVTFPQLAPGFVANLTVTDEGKLRLTALSDAVAGEGTTLDEAARLLAPDCGAGLCGAGVMPMLGVTLLNLLGLRCVWHPRLSR